MRGEAPHRSPPASPASGFVAVAVTGGIGAGKTSLCRILRRFPGVVHVDADRIVRGLLSGNPVVYRDIHARCGPGVLRADGRLDRTRLAARVFGDRRELRWLEDLLHPRVQGSLMRKVRALKRRGGVGIVLVEIPLLAEVGVPSWCDLVVTVEAGEALRLARLERRGVNAGEAKRRMVRQTTDGTRRAKADFIIRNDGDFEELEKGARRLWERLFLRERD
ncbi:MAG: dephospho-CoA kinase [Candidatus Eisenbacteria sp.]|nr:dephospho-CoA kinase [Candidatus Eisenbacteria bacterium]